MCVICIQQVDIHLKKFVNKVFFLGNISFPSSLILVAKEQLAFVCTRSDLFQCIFFAKEQGSLARTGSIGVQKDIFPAR